jgi:hypothetical protein
MASYTRQSSFADGDTITAALFNNEFNQLVNAFHNSTGHKHDGTTAEGPVIGLIGDAGETAPNNKVLIDTTNNFIEFYVQVSSSPVQQLYIADGAIIPVTDSDVDLGTTSLRFKDTYTDTVTTTGNVSVGGNLTVTGTTTFNGGTITMGDAATDNVVFGADVDSNIIPDDDDTYDLGSASQQWRNIFIDGTAEIDTLAINGTTVTSTAAELNILDGVTSTAAELNILDGVTASATDINLIDGITNGTVIASKAIITDSNKDITGGRNITISGELDAATLDISGDADIDGTLEADAITIAGVTLAETISDTVGAMVSSNTETNITVTYEDSDNTLDFALPASLEITTAVGVGGGSTNGVVISQGAIKIKNGGAQSYIDFYCESSNAHYARLLAPAHSAFSGNVTITLPATTDTLVGKTTTDTLTNKTLTSPTISAPAITGTATFGGSNGVSISQGAISIKNGGTQSYVDFYCESSNAHKARLQAPAHSSFSGDIVATLPATTGTIALTSSDITGNAATATALATARTIHGVSFNGTANIDLSEVVQDTVGAMFSSNTETGIAATYEDGDGTIDLVIGNDVIVNSMIADDAVANAQIADDAIDSAQIADGAIDTAHIANDQVTGDKLSNDVTIANDLTVAGNLVVTGSTTQTGSLLSNSNFQALSQNNSGNSTDFGFYGKYVESSTAKFAGLAFDASTDNTFRLFVDTQTAPGSTVNTGATGYAVGTLVSNLTGNVTGNASGTAATVTGAAQSSITSLGTLTTLTVDNVVINGTTIGHTDDTDLMTLADGVLTVAGEVDAASLDISGNVDIDGVLETDNLTIGGAQGTDGQVLTSTGSGVGWEDASGGGASSINDLSDAKTFGTSSIMIGSASTGTIDAANYNTGVGLLVLGSLTSGDNNTVVGYNTGAALTSGEQNTFIGTNAGQAVTTGDQSVAVGQSALLVATTGNKNAMFGHRAGAALTTASESTFIGNEAGESTTTGANNVFVGHQAGESNTTGHSNVGIGNGALDALTDGHSNTAVGYLAASSLITGSPYQTRNNVAIGREALETQATQEDNVCIGYQALGTGNSASNSQITAIGSQTANAAHAAYGGTYVGYQAGNVVTSGVHNTFIGREAGDITTTGDRNICIGVNANGDDSAAYRCIVISTFENTGKGDATFLISAGTGSGNGFQGNNSSAWATTSDRRIKKNIVDNNVGLDKIKQIQVKNFEYRTKDEITDWTGRAVDSVTIEKEGTQLGVIAQEIQEILPDVVQERENGCLSVDSDNITWYLVNAVKQQQTIIDDLKSRIEALED